MELNKKVMQGWMRSLLASVIYPLKDRRWFAKSWPLPLVALVPFIAFLAPILYKGWRLCAIRQLIHDDNTLPALDLLAFLRRGILLWAFTFLYLLVPFVLFSVLGFGAIGLLLDVVSIGAEDAGTVQEWATGQVWEVLWMVLIYALWAIISLPVYQAGLVRYAINRSWTSMFNIPANFALFVRHAQAFLMFYINWVVITLCVAIAALLLTVTIVGVLLLPLFVLTVYYVSTAHELGHLARRIVASDSTMAARLVPASN